MNEQIKLLAEQARTEANDLVCSDTWTWNEWHDCFNKKFAELIVRECAKFLDENSGYNDSDGCWFPEPEDMLKHFGVEE